MAKQPKAQDTSDKTRKLAEKAATIATKLIDNWNTANRTRFNTIQEYEENYVNKVRPRTTGRSNFPVPVLARFLDEVHSRLDESPLLKFDSQVSISRKLVARKITAIVGDLKKPQKGNWDKKDRESKRMCEFAGYNAVETYSETIDGKFQIHIDPIHHTEFVYEIGAGNDLEKHQAVGRFPIWRTKDYLESRAASGFYDSEQVKELIAKTSETDWRKNNDFFANKTAYLKSLGIDIESNKYTGDPVFPLAQMQMTIDGKRWLLTYDYWSGIWIRFSPLIEVFPSGMYSIDMWQSTESTDVTCKSICDDIYPFCEGIRVKVNQLFDNHTKRIYTQRGYDPDYVPSPEQLIWRGADQLTRMKSKNGKPISQGIYEFKSEDMTESTIKFMDWMDNFLVSTVGINPNDVSDETQKVALMFGQLAKTASRLGGKSKSYNEMYQRIGFRVLHELKAFMSEPQAIRMIGTKGVEWDEFVGKELDDPSDFDIFSEGSNVELEMSEARKKAQGEAMDQVLKDPDLKGEINPRVAVEYILKGKGQFKEEEVGRLMDKQSYGNEDMMARADLACEEIIKDVGQYHIATDKQGNPSLPQNEKNYPVWHSDFTPKLYPGADGAFLQYIMDFANKLDEDEIDKKLALIAYGRAHKQIVIRNMAQKGMGELAKKGIDPSKVNNPLIPKGPPAPGNGAPQPPMPSPAMHQKVKARGAKPMGHMPIPKVGGGAPARMPSKKAPPAPVSA